MRCTPIEVLKCNEMELLFPLESQPIAAAAASGRGELAHHERVFSSARPARLRQL